MTANRQTAFVFARGGSKGVRNKNIREAGGKPLLAHAIACALSSRSIGRVVVSTDSDAIAEVARRHGAEVLARPAELASDQAPENLAWRHAIRSLPDVFAPGSDALFISVPATSPLRTPEDVDAAVERFRKGGCDVVFGISPSRRSPYLNMVTIGPDGLLRIAVPGPKGVRRQDMPAMYDVTTCVYVASPDFVMTCDRLMDGRVGYVLIPPERALDVDDEFDLHLADLLLARPFRGTTP